MHETNRKIKFFLAENTGLQTSLVKVEDRKSERLSFIIFIFVLSTLIILADMSSMKV